MLLLVMVVVVVEDKEGNYDEEIREKGRILTT
jgi:hypothetical protein